MKDGEEEKRWVLCPWCGAKTRLQILRKTELVTFPLFCPKCRHESIINAKNFNDIHEGYNASPRSKDTYEIGNVTSIEPGIYIPNKFGIRIEMKRQLRLGEQPLSPKWNNCFTWVKYQME